VASIGEEGYATLTEALAAVQADETINLLKDTSIDPTNSANKIAVNGVTLNFNGNTVTVTSTGSFGTSWGIRVQGTDVKFVGGEKEGKKGGITVAAEAVETPVPTTAILLMNVDDTTSAELTLNGVAIDAKNCSAIMNYRSTLNVNNSTINHVLEEGGAEYAAIDCFNKDKADLVTAVNLSGSQITNSGTVAAIGCSWQSVGAMNVTVENSTITGGAAGILQMSKGKVTIEDSTIACEEAAIAMTKGELEVSESEEGKTVLSASSTEGDGKFVPSADHQVHPQGAAIYVESSGVENVEISGGTITSANENVSAVWAPEKAEDTTIAVSGGTFSDPVDSEWVTAEAVLVDEGTYTYGETTALQEKAKEEGGTVFSADTDPDDLETPVTAELTFAAGHAEAALKAPYNAKVEAKVGEVITLPDADTAFETKPANGTFKGWNDNCEDCQKSTYHAAGNYTVPAATVTLTAVWDVPQPVTVKVTLSAGAGTFKDTVVKTEYENQKAGDQITLPTAEDINAPEDAGEFLGFVASNDTAEPKTYHKGTYTVPALEQGAADITLTAQWGENEESETATVTFDPAPGEWADDSAYATSASITVTITNGAIEIDTLPAATDVKEREGFKLTGWKYGEETYTDEDLPISISNVSKGDSITLTAVWEENEPEEEKIPFTVTYKLDAADAVWADETEGDKVENKEANADGTVTITLLGSDAAIREGYELTGWKDADDVTHELATEPTLDLTGITENANVELTAVWTQLVKINYTVTYKLGADDATWADGTTADKTASSFTYDGNATISLPAAPTREGYKLSGWDVNGTKQPTGETVSVTNITEGMEIVITAQWEEDAGNDEPTPPSPDEEPTFKDVPATSYFFNAVEWGVANNIVAGTTATTFSPEALATRAQFVSFLWRASGRPEPQSTVNPFTDVKESDYFYKAVLWAVENKIVSGTSATTFSPNSTCTRAQAVTFIWRHAGRPNAAAKAAFTDVPAKEYYSTAVAWGSEKKIVSGTSATTFAPNSTCTRAQAVTFLYRYIA
ncbi:MAG: S-layer homology domain-containing protein, partial [Acutalibacter sp.]|nr:S-layer homology domain-containing protein [Acutalibacter sp.]